jgi:hypothetical protein
LQQPRWNWRSLFKWNKPGTVRWSHSYLKYKSDIEETEVGWWLLEARESREGMGRGHSMGTKLGVSSSTVAQ